MIPSIRRPLFGLLLAALAVPASAQSPLSWEETQKLSIPELAKRAQQAERNQDRPGEPKAKASRPTQPTPKKGTAEKGPPNKAGVAGITNLWGVDRPPPKEEPAFGPADDFRTTKGQLTFDAEGKEGGRYHSRRPHWPGGASGVTIGRGYDMKLRKKEEVLAHLTRAGVAAETAERLAAAAGLSGDKADKFVDENRDTIELTPRQQRLLFEAAYGAAEADVRRISAKDDVVKAYGAAEWDKLDPVVRDLLVDLRYVGHYTPETRKKVQTPAVGNDVAALAELFEDPVWTLNDPGRQKRRAEHLRTAAAAREKPAPKPSMRLP